MVSFKEKVKGVLFPPNSPKVQDSKIARQEQTAKIVKSSSLTGFCLLVAEGYIFRAAKDAYWLLLPPIGLMIVYLLLVPQTEQYLPWLWVATALSQAYVVLISQLVGGMLAGPVSVFLCMILAKPPAKLAYQRIYQRNFDKTPECDSPPLLEIFTGISILAINFISFLWDPMLLFLSFLVLHIALFFAALVTGGFMSIVHH